MKEYWKLDFNYDLKYLGYFNTRENAQKSLSSDYLLLLDRSEVQELQKTMTKALY